MSKSKLTPLEVVERYHSKYLEYEAAFNKDPFSEDDLRKQLEEVALSDIDTESDDFLDKMMEIVIAKPRKRADVNNAAFKFSLFTDFYSLTNENPLPDKILKDYDALPIKDNIKTYYSIKDGNFVKNEKEEITEDMRDFFKKQVEYYKTL